MLRWQQLRWAMLVAMPLCFALGCSHARQQAAASPMIDAAPTVSPFEESAVSTASAAYPIVPHHALATDPHQRPVSPRRYPIAVAPLRTYGCCH